MCPRKTVLHRLFSTVLAAGLLMLAACANAPQILPIQPQVARSGSSGSAAERSLSVKVIDARDNEIVGYRNPQVAASVLTAAPEMIEAIEQALQSGYREQGFRVVSADESADIALEVRLTELSYARESSGIMRELKTAAAVEAVSTMQDKTVNAIYRAGQGRDSLFAPTQHDNAATMNAHVDAVLDELLSDTRLTTP